MGLLANEARIFDCGALRDGRGLLLLPVVVAVPSLAIEVEETVRAIRQRRMEIRSKRVGMSIIRQKESCLVLPLLRRRMVLRTIRDITLKVESCSGLRTSSTSTMAASCWPFRFFA